MANPEFEALKIANDVSLNSLKQKEIGQKNRFQKGEIGLKRAQILSALPSSTDTAGDSLIGAANSMAQSPRNASTGIVEGLLRAFGGNLKGKAADEKRKQIMDSLDVLDYTMESEEYLQKTQEQIAKQKNDMQYRPSQKQYEQSYSDGTIDQTLKATFQQMGIDPNKVQRSSDGLNVYIEKDGKITKAPVSDFFSPEDSQKFQFINSTQKANLAQSENKQVQGLAQENNMLKSRLDVLEEQYKQIEGISPVMAKSLARGVVDGERVQQNEDAMKERGFSLQERGLGIQQQNADTSRMAVENKEKEDKAKSPEDMEKETYLRLYDLLSQEKVDPTIGAGTGIKNWAAQNVPLVSGLIGESLAPQQEYQQLLADLKGLRFKKFGYRNQAEFNKIKTLDENLPKEQAKKFVANELKKMGIDVAGSETVKIAAKDGSIWDIPKSKVDDALKRGASLAQ